MGDLRLFGPPAALPLRAAAALYAAIGASCGSLAALLAWAITP